MEYSSRLQLPYIMASQAQKHVTHNEAVRMLDCLVQPVIKNRTLTSPPASPQEGDGYIVAAGGADAWSGKDGRIAVFEDGAWQFHAASAGWSVYDAGAVERVVFTGSEWAPEVDRGGRSLSRFGVNTDADASNRVAVKSDAVLLSHDDVTPGTGDMQVKINKAATGNTASFLFQTGWSGRAEFGLAGDDDWHVKVSADGAAWTEAFVVDGGSGETAFKAPMTVQVNDGVALSIDLEGGSGVFQATRYIDGSAAPVFFGRKARGTRAAPTAVLAGDTLIGFRGYGHTGTGFAAAAQGVAFLLEASEDWSDAAFGTQIRFFTTQNGTAGNSVERLRISNSGDVQMDGDNTVINASRHPVLRAYALASLPAASPEGQLIHVSDGSSNRRLAVSDGTNWRFPDGSVVS